MTNDQILNVSIEARITKLERDMLKAKSVVGRNFDAIEKRSAHAAGTIERHFDGVGAHVGALGKGMAAGIAGLVGGVVISGVSQLVSLAAETARGFAEIGDEAKRAGVAVEAFQELRFVAEQNRIGVDSLVDGLKELNLRADEFIVTGGGPAAEAFRRLGYDAETLKTKLRDPSALFTEIIGKLGTLDRAAQIRIADEIFGGTGGEKFVQLIEQGEAALNRTRQEARDLGLVLDADLIERAAELDRQFNAIANTVGTALKSAIVQAAAALSDFMGQFQAFEARGTAMLERNMAELGSERVDVENRMLAIQGNIRSSGGQDPSAEMNMRDALGVLADRMEKISAEESRILGVLAARDPAPPAPAPANPPDVVVSGATPIAPISLPARGGGGGGMREQRDAAADLIQKLREELALMGQSEMEQRVNAELRRAGANATDEQKASIRELVTQIETESAALKRIEDATASAKGATRDFLSGLLGDLRNGVDGATALANAFGRLADRLIDMALDTLINSLFENLMSGAGGGLLGGILGFAEGGAVEAATGGHIRGPGTGTSDSIPARLSNGEFVVNAQATKSNLDLLHAINRGELPAFALGGLVGDGPSFRPANDNAYVGEPKSVPAVTINAPITVNGSAGTPEQNSDLAKRMRREMEGGMRAVVASEIARQMRPGNTLNTRSR